MAKTYSVGIVGESNYQSAIRDLREGEKVFLEPEPDNRHDPRAIAVRDGDGETIGYIPRDHWLTGAMLDEGKAARATVEAIFGGERGKPMLGVCIEVELGAPGRMEGAIRAASAAGAHRPAPTNRGYLPPNPEQDRRNRQLGFGCIGLIVLVALIGMCTPDSDTAPGASSAAVAKLPEEAVAKCRKLLATGEQVGVIKSRPAPNRINVDDALWAQLDAETKDRTMQAVACDVWQTSMPPSSDHVVAYGHRSGKRVQMLTSVGMVRE